jgi:glutathione S-transferase
MKLYDFTLSGHAHRARLFLSLLSVPAELHEMDLGNGEHRTGPFLSLNPFGQVPVLVDGDVVVTDSTAILVYLAKKHGPEWLPSDPVGAARVQKWLSVSSGEIAYGPCAARLLTVFRQPFDASEVIARAHGILKLIDAELAGRDWIAADRPTIADVALYSYIARANEGNVDRFRYGHITAWLDRVESLPGFLQFPKSGIGLPEPDGQVA